MSEAAPAEIDDETLLRLAAEAERPLFPLLDRAEAMVPLIVVLAFLPALYAVEFRTLTEAGAWQGLASLKCRNAAGLNEFVDPAPFEQDQPYRFQPPFMSWLTGLSMKLFGVGNVAGLLGPAYLCTAGLILAGYILGRRLGGESLGLVSAALLAFHPQLMKGAQEPMPQSAAILFGVLALAGTAAHWQKASALTSYELLLGGLSLGLCLLAGGVVALAVVLILLVYALTWKFEAWIFRSWGLGRDSGQFNRRTAFRSTAILAATGFALGGWYPLLMGSRYGTEFWQAWLRGGQAASATTTAHDPSIPYVLLEINNLAPPLWGLILIGLFGAARDVCLVGEDPAMSHRALLPVWGAVALFAWILSGGFTNPDLPWVSLWKALLIVALLMLAAVGLIEIVKRRIPFSVAIAAGLLSVITTAVALKSPPTDPDSAGVLVLSLPRIAGVSVNPGVLALLAILAGFALHWFAERRDVRRRVILRAMLLILIAAHCLAGLSSVRRTNPGDRELDDMRFGLARIATVKSCAFVGLSADNSPSPLRPPAQLIFSLSSLWPDARITFSGSWEEAEASTAASTDPDEKNSAIFIAWSPRGLARRTAPAASLKSAAPPLLYRGFEIVAYLR